jgi:hypothetical protein
MTSRTPRLGAIGLALCATLGALSACTHDASPVAGAPVPAYRLVAFTSCDDALNQVRTAAKAAVGPYGFNSGYGVDMQRGGVALPPVAPVPQAASNAGSSKSDALSSPSDTPAYSGTNTAEVGVDEPDLVKTDGHRIVVVHQGVLKVIDAASAQLTGSVSLNGSTGGVSYGSADLLLAGDHALVLVNQSYGTVAPGVSVPDGVDYQGSAVGAAPAPAGPPVVPSGPSGPQLILVDLTGQPRVLSRLAVDGSLLDARQTGSVARVVVSSSPRITFPSVSNLSDAQRVEVNRSIIDQVTLDHWVPRIAVTTGSTTMQVPVGCDAISRPSVYSGSNMLTVLSLDLSQSSLADPQPVSILADGQTIYSNGASLYVATDARWRTVLPMASSASLPKPDTGTTIYQFDTSKPGRPSFVAGGEVPGYLINQYAMSARNGYLRVATTSGNANWESSVAVDSQSGVYVVHPDGSNLSLVGKVEGLGKGEKIYAVRFLDNVGYVVTFKQTDPLYTVDLSDPTKPTVHGELKITGYSSYLHPIDNHRLIGIGQDVTAQLRTAGTQISLFDVSNVDNPTRLDVYQMPGTSSAAEFDPHAFLYWPATGTLVIPLNSNMYGGDGLSSPGTSALVLHVSGNTISPVGSLTQLSMNGYDPIQRSLVIGSTLWTISNNGLMASDLLTLQRIAWIPLI